MMREILIVCLLTISSLISTICVGQEAPAIINFTPDTYKSGQQNWSISQSSDRTMYFGNTNGLISFDGSSWKVYSLPDNKVLRSVSVYNDKIYTGGYNEIGYWQRDSCYDLVYHSLNELVPDHALEKEEIWHILPANGKIYFQSFSVILVYDGINMEKIKLPGNVMFLQNANDRLYIQVINLGLYELLPNNSFILLQGSHILNDKTVTSVLAHNNDSILITTSANGIYSYKNGNLDQWNASKNQYFSEVQINKASIIHGNQICIGTIRDGMWILDQNGNDIMHINKVSGLQNNTILSLNLDCDGNLWLGLDKGIALVDLKSPFYLYNDLGGTLGSVYCGAMVDSILYLGTNQGVYYFDKKIKSESQFHLIKGSQGHVWDLKPINGGVFCGHNEGSFFIKGNALTKISNINGGWHTEYYPKNKSKLIQCTYNGLLVYDIFSNEIKLSHIIKGIEEPIKKITWDNDNCLWLAGPIKGLYKVQLDTELTKVTYIHKYGVKEGLPNDNNLDLNKFNESIVVKSGKKHFKYDSKLDLFKPYDLLNNEEEEFKIRNAFANTWIKVYSDKIQIENSGPTFFNLKLNQDYHCITELDSSTLLFAEYEGYALCNKKGILTNAKSEIHLILDKIELSNNGKCIPILSNKEINIHSESNTFKIYFHHPDFLNSGKNTIFLSGVDKQPRFIQNESFVNYSNLHSGTYVLEVRSNDKLINSIEIIILPPWYQSNWALMAYVLTCSLLAYLLYLYFHKKLEQEKKKLEIENERILREHKIQLENERLHQENILKSKELANVAVHLVEKNELLLEIKEEIIEARKHSDTPLTTQEFQNLMKLINENNTIKEDKNLFESNFNEVHEEFLKSLKQKYPELSPADLTLAAYLKMNLSSKEIAPLFNISLRGLENKRYRLRKKMGLSNDVNLTEYFMNM